MLATQPAPTPRVHPDRLTDAERQMLALIGQLIARIDDQEHRLADLAEWLEELAGDTLEREGVVA